MNFLKSLLEIPSETGNEAQAAQHFVNSLAGAGLETRIDAVGNAIALSSGTEGRRLLFLGHIDTVPGQVHVRIEDGCLYGRGAVDAKGPLAAAAVAATRCTNTIHIEVIGAVGEEGPSHGARHLLKSEPPDSLIIGEPGGSDAIVLGYRGSMRATFRFSLPTGHSAGPLATVCDTAVESWERVKSYCASVNRGAATFDSLSPALLDFGSGTDGLVQTATLHANFRLPADISVEHAQRAIAAAASPGAVEFAPGDPAYKAPKSSPLVSNFLRCLRAEGVKPRFKYKTGTSDMNVVAPVWKCPTVAYGPGDSTLDHTPNEHISIEEFLRGVRVLTRLFQEWR